MEDGNTYSKESDWVYTYSPPTFPTFQGASTSYRLDRQGLNNFHPDEIAARELLLLQRRSLDTIRNNPESATCLQNHRQNLNALKVEWKDAKGKRQSEMQDLWDEFFLNPSLDGFGDGGNLQDAWNADIFTYGEALGRFLIQKRDGITVPLVVQNIPPTYLSPFYKGNDNTKTRNGITFENNAPSIYHFDVGIDAVDFRLLNWNNPDIYNTKDFGKISVPADEVLHIFDRKFGPGQWRGIPIESSGLLNTYGMEDLIDALNQRQLSAQAIHWVVTRNGGIAGATGSKINVIDKGTKEEKVIFKYNGGQTQYLNKGEEIKQFQGASLGGEVLDLLKLLQRRKARASGTTYEKMTGDLANVNMSSLQQLELDLKAYAEFWYEFILIPRGLRPLCNKFQSFASLYAKSKVTKAKPSFIYPKRYSVNSLKDLQASLLGLQTGLRLYTEELAKEGYTPEEVQEDKKIQESLGMKFELPNPNIAQAQTSNVKPNPNSKSF